MPPKRMLQPELKSLISPDLNEGQLPDDPEACAVFFEAEIGIKGKEGGDIFSFTAITPQHLNKHPETRWGRGYLIVELFAWKAVEQAVQKLLSHCEGETWKEISGQLSKEMHWEFENYQPYKEA